LQAFHTLRGVRENNSVVELVDNNGKILSSAPVYILPSYGRCNCSDDVEEKSQHYPYVFKALLKDVVADNAFIRVRRQEKQVWVRHAPPEPLQIKSFTASKSKERSIIIIWKVNPNQKPEVCLQWSEEKGEDKRWFGLATALTGERAEIDILRLPSGLVHIRMLANDGFYTAISAPDSI
jgi:hypothetical protein